MIGRGLYSLDCFRGEACDGKEQDAEARMARLGDIHPFRDFCPCAIDRSPNAKSPFRRICAEFPQTDSSGCLPGASQRDGEATRC